MTAASIFFPPLSVFSSSIDSWAFSTLFLDIFRISWRPIVRSIKANNLIMFFHYYWKKKLTPHQVPHIAQQSFSLGGIAGESINRRLNEALYHFPRASPYSPLARVAHCKNRNIVPQGGKASQRDRNECIV